MPLAKSRTKLRLGILRSLKLLRRVELLCGEATEDVAGLAEVRTGALVSAMELFDLIGLGSMVPTAVPRDGVTGELAQEESP